MDVTLIVDGANVMGSRADGWWRDRTGAMARLHGELAALAARGIRGPVPGDAPAAADEASSVDEAGSVDGPSSVDEPGSVNEAGSVDGTEGAGDDAAGHWHPQVILVVEGRARGVLDLVSPAPGVQVVAARGEGDDEIAGLARRVPGRRVVVTADRELRRRAEATGAAVAGPGWLIRQFG
jgi:hypothetical protein